MGTVAAHVVVQLGDRDRKLQYGLPHGAGMDRHSKHQDSFEGVRLVEADPLTVPPAGAQWVCALGVVTPKAMHIIIDGPMGYLRTRFRTIVVMYLERADMVHEDDQMVEHLELVLQEAVYCPFQAA